MQTLQARQSRAADFTGDYVALDKPARLLVCLEIFSAERDSADETYQIHITTKAGDFEWDIAAFPQIATTGAKKFVMTIDCQLSPKTVTTAAPGVEAVRSGSLAVETGGTNAIKSLGAGLARHGMVGEFIGHSLDVSGSITANGIDYAITFLQIKQ